MQGDPGQEVPKVIPLCTSHQSWAGRLQLPVRQEGRPQPRLGQWQSELWTLRTHSNTPPVSCPLGCFTVLVTLSEQLSGKD